MCWSISDHISSASLWGCELKFLCLVDVDDAMLVSLLVRLWVEMGNRLLGTSDFLSQPPCEAVSWNGNGKENDRYQERQPPCEAVSWNAARYCRCGGCCVSLLVRLWVEMTLSNTPRTNTSVSLLVRLWVEISCCSPYNTGFSSASLWGCELKCWCSINKSYIYMSASLWGCELKWTGYLPEEASRASASLWGCELKY